MRIRDTGGRVRVVLIVVSAALALAIASPTAAAASQPTAYLSLGDSLAWGDGASVPDETGYTALLADYFAGIPHGGAKTWTNLAVRGETTASYLAGQAVAALGVIADPTTDTRVVTVSLGGNDVGALLNDPSDACFQNPASPECQALVAGALQMASQNYRFVLGSLALALAADEGDEQVYVMTVFNPFGGLGAPYQQAVDVALLGTDLGIDCQSADPMAYGLNDIIACTAMQLRMTVVDGYGAIGDSASTLTHIGEGTLDTHPNDRGYELLAKAHRLATSR